MSGECRLEIKTIEKAGEIQAEKITPHNQTNVGSHDQAQVSTKDILGVTDDKELLHKLNIEGKKTSDAKEREQKLRARIQRVPEIMLRDRRNYEEYYQPRELSIGPIHANSSLLLKKELKFKLAATFIEKSGLSGESLLHEIKNRISDLKKYFDEQLIKSYNDDSFARLLFLDGCSILQFIYSCAFEEFKELRINNGQAALIQQDLLLAENQIPFLVLQLLMNMSNARHILEVAFFVFVRMNNMMVDSPRFSQVRELIDKDNVVHLLDFFRSVLLIGDEGVEEYNDGTDLDTRTRYSFRNVQELKSAGIVLKPSDCSLRSVSFATRCFITGQLKLPPMIVDDSTAGKLLNLATYEMCLNDYDANCSVTSYVNFLDLLIDCEQDVKELRASQVLRNRLCSDAEVAKVLNHVGSNCLAPPRDDYLRVKRQIQKHYEKNCAVWMAQAYHNHFSSPWTVVALVAAAIALVLTGIQTWYTIHPQK